MRILVTGATGFLGRALVEALLRAGHHVRALTRSKERAAKILPENSALEIVEADVTEPETLTGVAEGIDVIYHLAGMLGQHGADDELYWRLNCRGTKHMLEVASRVSGLKRFVHCGSAGVQGPIANQPADESRPYAPSNIYETTKTEAEKLALEAYQKQGIPVTVLRPEFVYGPGDTHVLGLFQAIAKGHFVIFGRGGSLLHPTYIDDVTKSFLLCLEAKEAKGKVYIIAAERPVTVQELAYTIAGALGVRKPFHVPVWIGYTGAFFFEALEKVLGITPILNRARVRYFIENRAFDISLARQELGYTPNYNLAQGVAETVRWYKERRYL